MPVFEYAIVRLVPEVHKAEFINVGVILYCKELGFLDMKYHINKDRVKALFSEISIEELEQHLQAFLQITKGNKKGKGIEALDQASRFRWLIAKRSTIIQTSAVHPGICNEPVNQLDILYKEQVS